MGRPVSRRFATRRTARPRMPAASQKQLLGPGTVSPVQLVELDLLFGRENFAYPFLGLPHVLAYAGQHLGVQRVSLDTGSLYDLVDTAFLFVGQIQRILQAVDEPMRTEFRPAAVTVQLFAVKDVGRQSTDADADDKQSEHRDQCDRAIHRSSPARSRTQVNRSSVGLS